MESQPAGSMAGKGQAAARADIWFLPPLFNCQPWRRIDGDDPSPFYVLCLSLRHKGKPDSFGPKKGFLSINIITNHQK
jgi:hypothetical protein